MSKQTITSVGLLVVVMATLCWPALGQQDATEKIMLESGQQLYASGKLEEAEAQLSKVIKKYPQNGRAYFLRGELKLVLRDYDGSIADTNYSIKLAPKAPGVEIAYNNRAAALQLKGELDEALADFDKAIAINPNYPPPYNGRGVILREKGRLDEALIAFNKAVELNPRFLFPYVGRGEIRFQKLDFQGALSDFNRAIDGGAAHPTNIFWRGITLGMIGNWELAIADLRKAFQLDNIQANRFAASLDSSFADLDTFLANNTKNGNVYSVRGFVNLLRKRDSEALNDFNTSFKLNDELRVETKELVEFIKKNRAN